MEKINDAVDISSLIDDDTELETNEDVVNDATDISALFADDADFTDEDVFADAEHTPKLEKNRKKKKNKSPLLLVLLIIFSLVFVFSAYKLISIRISMKKAAEDFNNISEQFHDEEPENNNVPGENEKPKPLTSAERFAKMRKINPDFALWISIDGTVLDYPVMFTPNNPEYYLHLDFYNNYSFSGTPFIGAGCTPDSNSMIIYGHCMKDGSMFRTLLDYEQYHYYSDHPSFTIETVNGTETYDIISVFRERVHFSNETNVFRYYNYVGNLDEATFNEYVNQVKAISLYYIDANAKYGDKIISLSTCHYADENARLVVVGVKR